MPTTQLTYRTREGDVTNAADWGVVFLSYRKKNVVYRNDVVRDILDANDCAVWFDRNLTAGEDYNAEIDAALDRMNVFVLLVTPLTFEPDSYVMKKEIPRALERKIRIIPVILEETDMERFAKVLGNIHSLDKRKPDEYEDGLRKALSLHLLTKDEKERIHMAQRESAPRAAQTIYLQGLGWLTGENCERDPDKGAQMITAAAMSGECPEAVLRLAQMYETGDGVARSWNAAIDWYGRYTAAMEPRFGQNEDDDGSIAKAYDSRGKLLRDSGRLTASREAFTAYNRHCEQMVAHYGGKSERELSISYERLGDVCQADGDLSGAKAYYGKALAIAHRHSATCRSATTSSATYARRTATSPARRHIMGRHWQSANNWRSSPRARMHSATCRSATFVSATYARRTATSPARRHIMGSHWQSSNNWRSSPRAHRHRMILPYPVTTLVRSTEWTPVNGEHFLKRRSASGQSYPAKPPCLNTSAEQTSHNPLWILSKHPLPK